MCVRALPTVVLLADSVRYVCARAMIRMIVLIGLVVPPHHGMHTTVSTYVVQKTAEGRKPSDGPSRKVPVMTT